LKKLVFILILFPAILYSAFELIDCIEEGIFESPTKINGHKIQTLYARMFGILSYTRISYYGKSPFGIGVSSFGNELYKENEFLLGYNWRKEDIKLGISVRWMRLWIKERIEDFAFGVDFGVSTRTTSWMTLNLVFHNLNFPKISDIEIPQRLIGEGIIKIKSDVTTYLQVYKEAMYPIELRIRNKIKIHNMISIEVGVKTYPISFIFGLSLTYKKLGISYFTRTHETLGLTHILSVKIRM
jgi:hypothetical protein